MATQNSRRIKAVIFDLDDTLIDWSAPAQDWRTFTRPMADNVYDYLKTAGYDLPGRDEFVTRMNQEVNTVWQEAKQDWSGPSFSTALHRTLAACQLPADEIDLDHVMRVYGWKPMPGVDPFPDALDVLHTLRQRGYRLGLITNSFFPMWMRDVELEAYDLLELFDARTTSSDAGYMKPHPGIYHYLLEELGVRPEEALFVGDRPENDIAGANEAGLISVLMDPPHLERDLKGVRPDYTITTLSELLPILAALEQDAAAPVPAGEKDE